MFKLCKRKTIKRDDVDGAQISEKSRHFASLLAVNVVRKNDLTMRAYILCVNVDI